MFECIPLVREVWHWWSEGIMRTAGFPANGILSVQFNQDKSRIAVGTKSGTRTYSIEPFQLLRELPGDDASIIAMHYNSDLVAHVGAGEIASSSQRCLRMINTRRDKEITRTNYGKAIRNVLLNRDRVVVVLSTTIYIYELTTMEHLHTIEEIPENAGGVCALPSFSGVMAGDQQFNYLAYPNNGTKGCVHVYDVLNLRAGPIIEAHSSRIGALAFNDTGTLLATASIKGTVFRVFGMPTGEKLYEFRRGLATNATIFSMAFNPMSSLLCVSSDKPTIHLFKLATTGSAHDDGGWTGYLSNTMTSAASYLPTSVSEMWTQSRSFAQINLKKHGTPNLVALCGLDKVSVLVATSDGYLYRYSVDSEDGGECMCTATYTLSPTIESKSASGDEQYKTPLKPAEQVKTSENSQAST